MAVEEALQIVMKKKRSRGEKEIYTHLNEEFQRITRRKPSSVISAKK